MPLAQDMVFPGNLDIEKCVALMAELCCDPDLGEGDDEVRRWGEKIQLCGVNYPDINARALLINSNSYGQC